MTRPAQRTWIIDLDGVIWRGSAPVPGSASAVDELHRRGDRVLFATNHSAPTRTQLLDKLASLDVTATPAGVVTSADAAASLLAPGDRVHAFAGDGVVEAIERRGATVTANGAVDVVLVGWHEHLDLAGMTRAVRGVLSGARLIATNDDPLRPASDGVTPGAGAYVAAVEAATGATATRAGKPHPPMAGVLRPLLQGQVIVVGDSRLTDGGLAEALGAQFALVLSGVTSAAPSASRPGELVAADLAAVVAGTASR